MMIDFDSGFLFSIVFYSGAAFIVYKCFKLWYNTDYCNNLEKKSNNIVKNNDNGLSPRETTEDYIKRRKVHYTLASDIPRQNTKDLPNNDQKLD